MSKLRWYRLGLWSVAGLLLLSACDGWKLGWPNFAAPSSSGGSGGLGGAFAQAGGLDYLVNFICGTSSSGDPVVTGEYGTMVSIYNPAGSTITVSFRTSQSLPPGYPEAGDISPGFINRNIPSGRALEIDCTEIRSDFLRDTLSPLTAGILLVQSSVSIEVIATYTAGALGSVASISVERIGAR